MAREATPRRRPSLILAGPALAALLLAAVSPAIAQTEADPAAVDQTTTVEVIRIGMVTENPRGDSFVLGTIEPGTVLEVLEIRNVWYQVRAPAGVTEWRRGWLHERYLNVLTMAPDPEDPTPELRTSVRGFGQFGGIRFAAADSFDAVTGTSWGFLWGGGAQFGLSNGLFFQGSYERYSTTGQRVFVFDDEIFELGVDNKVTVTPIQATVGYRQATSGRYVGYIGAGVGWHRLEEEPQFGAASDRVDETGIGFHILGGIEYPITPWLWLGGEGQWAYVPEVLGDDGISAAFDENDLGGFTLRFKVSVGM